eukprot:scaffold1153_cov158-Alexandrium_tamarense.AAC.1
MTKPVLKELLVAAGHAVELTGCPDVCHTASRGRDLYKADDCNSHSVDLPAWRARYRCELTREQLMRAGTAGCIQGMSTSARDSLNAFIEDVGAPEGIKTDSAAEFTGRNSEFAKLCRKRSIRQTFQEAGRSNQIPHVDVQI